MGDYFLYFQSLAFIVIWLDNLRYILLIGITSGLETSSERVRFFYVHDFSEPRGHRYPQIVWQHGITSILIASKNFNLSWMSRIPVVDISNSLTK